MRDLIVAENITLDGVIDAAEGWFAPSAEEDADEYRLFVYPIVLGRGERLFEGATGAGKLNLVETRQFNSGAALMRYRPA